MDYTFEENSGNFYRIAKELLENGNTPKNRVAEYSIVAAYSNMLTDIAMKLDISNPEQDSIKKKMAFIFAKIDKIENYDILEKIVKIRDYISHNDKIKKQKIDSVLEKYEDIYKELNVKVDELQKKQKSIHSFKELFFSELENKVRITQNLVGEISHYKGLVSKEEIDGCNDELRSIEHEFSEIKGIEFHPELLEFLNKINRLIIELERELEGIEMTAEEEVAEMRMGR